MSPKIVAALVGLPQRAAVALAKPIPSLLLLMAIAVAAAVALRLVPQFAPVVGDWAELSIRQQLAAQQGKTVGEIAPGELASSIDAFIKAHTAEIEPARRALEQTYLGAITFEGEDGRRHLYLGGYDGYYWLRLVRW